MHVVHVRLPGIPRAEVRAAIEHVIDTSSEWAAVTITQEEDGAPCDSLAAGRRHAEQMLYRGVQPRLGVLAVLPWSRSVPDMPSQFVLANGMPMLPVEEGDFRSDAVPGWLKTDSYQVRLVAPRADARRRRYRATDLVSPAMNILIPPDERNAVGCAFVDVLRAKSWQGSAARDVLDAQSSTDATGTLDSSATTLAEAERNLDTLLMRMKPLVDALPRITETGWYVAAITPH
jgi:hypothetical protein